MISVSSDSADVGSTYTGISQLGREYNDGLVLNSENTLLIVLGKNRLPALNILDGMVTSDTDWSRNHIRVDILVRNDNATMTPLEVRNLGRYRKISYSKTKMDITVIGFMSSAIQQDETYTEQWKKRFETVWKSEDSGYLEGRGNDKCSWY